MYQLTIFINSVLASLLAEGSVSSLYYADRLFQFPLGVFSIALATAILPRLSRSASNKDEAALQHELLTGLRWVNVITIPATAGLIVLASPIIGVIFQRGNMTAEDANTIATALIAFSVGLWPISAQSLLVRTFLAKKNTRLPALVTSVSLVVNTLLAILLMGTPVANDTFAKTVAWLQGFLPHVDLNHAGLALAGSLTAFFSLVVSLLLLKRIGTTLSLVGLVPSLLRSAFAATAMSSFLVLLQSIATTELVQVLLGIPVGGGIYFGLLLILNDRDAKAILALVRKKAVRK